MIIRHLMFGILALTVEQLMRLTLRRLGRHPEQGSWFARRRAASGKLRLRSATAG